MADDLLDPKYQDQAVLRENQEHILDITWRFIAHLTAEEAYHGLQQLEFPTGAVRTPADTFKDPHWHDRGFFVEVEHPELSARFTYPGAASIFSASPWRISRRAPLIGEHNQEVYGELGVDAQRLGVLREAGGV
jgi:crotonobetainyl-CoA:carnitine CoA-transferase CaiB-like acyl-CoA transferase